VGRLKASVVSEPTLYERLGEREGIGAVVDEFYDRVLADDDLVAYFEDSDPAALRRHQTQFLSHVAGGPVEWDGDDMATAHDHLGVTPADFQRVAGHLDDALRELDVPDAEREEVMDAVASMEEAVVSADD
jgi:hemoglobin